MKKTIEVEFDVTTKAVLRNDDVTLTLSVSVPYLDRKVTVTEDQFTNEQKQMVREAIEAAVADKISSTFERAQAAAHESLLVSRRLEPEGPTQPEGQSEP